MRLWWAASFSVHEARIKRANFMTSFCSLWEASAMYDRTRDDRSHCRRAAAYRQSNRRSLTLVGLRDDGIVKLLRRLCQLSRHAGEAGHVNGSDRVYAAAIIAMKWAHRS